MADDSTTSTLEFPGISMGSLMGPRGATLKDVKQRSGAEVKVRRAGDAVAVDITGTAAQVRQAEQLMNEIAEMAENTDDVTETLEFPIGAAGVVLGTSGSNVKRIRHEFMVEVMLQKQDPICLVHVHGSREQVDDAVQAIRELVEGPGDSSNSGGADTDTASETLTFPIKLFGRLVGKGGENVKALQSNSGARVTLEKAEPLVLVHVAGTAAQVESAVAMVRGCAESSDDSWSGAAAAGGAGVPRPPSASPPSSHWAADDEEWPAEDDEWPADEDAGDDEEEEFGECELDFQEHDYMYIVGHGGQAIKDARYSTGATIVARKVNGRCEVTISGSPEQLQQAQEHIQGLVDAGRESEANAPQQEAPKREERGGRQHADEDEEHVTIGPKDAGRIIGGGGANIKQINAESGAHVVVEKSDDTVRIRGTVEAVEKARVMIAAILASSGPVQDLQGSTDYYLRVSRAEAIRLVGRGGRTKKEIQDETWAKLDVPIPENPAESCLVRVEGTFDAVEQALEKVRIAVAGGYGGGGGNGSAPGRFSSGTDKWRSDSKEWSTDDWGDRGQKRKWSSESWHS